MISRWLISGLLVLALSLSVSAQTVQVVKNKSHREGNNFNPTCPNPPLCDRYKMVSWDDSQIKQYAYRGIEGGNVVEFLNWRMAFPIGYDSTRALKYPMIVMLHGAGESGRIWTGNYNYPTSDLRFDNNGHNLLHGGSEHWAAVNRNPNLSNAFPGVVIWPQASYNGAWENGWNNGNLNETGVMVAKVVEWILQNMNIDPDRIYVHGLSNGGKGTWEMATKRADLFAAMLPMSGVGSNNTEMAKVLNTTPLWLFQGGTDTNPRPQASVDAIAALQAEGGTPRYTLYPNLGHGTWQTAYAEPDFFSWMLSKSKKNIYVFGGDPSICPGGSLKLGFSDKMLEYQWTFNGANIAVGGNTRFYNATQSGTYTVKYRRRIIPKGEITDWAESNPILINQRSSSDFSPVLSNTGSTILPILKAGSIYSAGPPSTGGLGNNNEIIFTTQLGYSEYQWYKKVGLADPVLVQTTGANVNTRTVSNNAGYASDEGLYTVRVKLASGCISAASNAISVTWNNPQPTTPQPNRPTMTQVSSTEALISWTDLPNEIGYELWRIRYGSGGYSFQGWSLVKVLSANTVSYTDSGLRPQAEYRYIVRAIHNTGGATFSEEPYTTVTTLPDLIPPTVPTNLIASNVTDTKVTLTWDPSLDNDVVYKYHIFNGSVKIDSVIGATNGVPPPVTTYTVNGLAPNSWYLLNVRAVDYKGNYSPFAEGVEVTTQGAANGLNFKYFTTTGLSGNNPGNQLAEPYTTTSGPNFNFSTATPAQTGVVSNFSIAGASGFQGNTSDPNNFVYSFDGYIQIDVAGNYRFYTSSDDGSRLYLDGTLLVNNDGAHGTQSATGVRNNVAVGKHAIRVTFFENGGGNELEVKYNWSTGGTPTNNYANASFIPDAKLFQSSTTITTYYLKTGTASPHLLSSWTSDPNGGSGTAPTNFSNALHYFVIGNRASVDLASSDTWAVSGNGSKVIVGKGTAITLNLNGAFTGKMDAAANAIINVGHATIPQFNVLDPTSTVNFNVAGTVAIPLANYGNVNLSTAQYNLPVSNTTVLGNLVMNNGVSTSGTANNLSTLRIGGNLTVNNTSGNPFPANGPNQYALVFTGSKTHTVSFITPVDPNLFSIQADFGDVVNFTGLSSRTFTVGTTQGGGLILNGSSVLNLGTNNLVVTGRGTINNNNESGAITMNGGNFTLSSTATQNSGIYFTAGSTVTNFTSSTPSNNRNSLGSTIAVTNLVTVNGGELNAGEGYLQLKSTGDAANLTARIGPLVSNGAKVTGKIKMERYMSGEGRIYRYISSPVRNVTAADLQAYFPITGNFTGASIISGVTSNASMFQYTEPTYIQFPAVGGNNLDTLRRGKGYTPFIREAGLPTTWVTTGVPYQGEVPFTITNNSSGNSSLGWNLLGNPYPAPIKWNAGGWTRNGVNPVAYIRENSNGSTIVKTHNGTAGTNGWDGVIAPGQAFWVRTETVSPNLTVTESAKQTSDGAFYREGWPDNTLEIIMKSAIAEDGTIIQFMDGATPTFDTNLDGVKLDNTFFNLSSLTSDGKAMAINLTTTNYCEQEIRLRTANASVGTYELNINGSSSIISGDEVTFIDNFTQTQKVISDTEVYTFSITDDPASKADGRFTLRLKKPEVVLNQTLKTDAACEQSSPIISVNNSQPGVTYQAFHNGIAISEGLTSTGGTLELAVNPALVAFGSTMTTIKAGFKGCNSFELPMTIAVQRDTLAVPEIMAEPFKLVASTENAAYQWYFNGEEMEDQTSRELLAPENGLYVVEVTLASCKKTSDTLEYVVTGLEKPNRLQQLYPNPTRDKVVVTMEQPIDFTSIRVITTIGQSLPVQSTRISNESAEVDFSQLPTGLYLLQVNRQRYRVLKE